MMSLLMRRELQTIALTLVIVFAGGLFIWLLDTHCHDCGPCEDCAMYCQSVADLRTYPAVSHAPATASKALIEQEYAHLIHPTAIFHPPRIS